MAKKEPVNLLQALLDVDHTPEQEVHLKRLGASITVKAVNGTLINKIKLQATRILGKGKKEIDENKFGALLIEKASVNFEWNAPALKEKYQAEDGAEVIERALLAGEIGQLTKAILDVSGFTDEADDDEIPN